MVAGQTNLHSFVGGFKMAFLRGVGLDSLSGTIPQLGGMGLARESIAAQMGAQLVSVVFTVVYSGVLSFAILKVVDAVVGLRVSDEEEEQGLDLTQHSEQGYSIDH